ncbi:long-chain-fatty-acid--CoA ligase [Sporosarcina luteola]|uniref:Long-chain-fatty-acid--CoA ligase n=1 Tax=Sporosarcina luteola TaxID=582850 RepID=A0A511Z339_9BACL|nr:class I adenylate-forming enzyme family protein [Sporosarcina luteola]GEN81859.1 long-chain-fatty-acid--CoA ligase [Sporosarcina luteola]
MKNQPLYEYLVHHSIQNPKKIAINFYGYEITYDRLIKEIDQMANYLYSLSVRKGETVAVFMQNSPQYVISYFAVQKLGATVGPCNPMFKEMELEYQLRDLEAKVLITTPDLYPVFEKIKDDTEVSEVILANYSDYLNEKSDPQFPEIISNKTYPETQQWKDVMKMSIPKMERTEINMKEDISLVIYTSGTTGSPKGAQLTFKNTEFKSWCVAENFKFSQSDVFVSVMPLFHIAGKLVGMTAALMAGGTVVIMTRFNSESMLRIIEKYKASVLYTTTPMNTQMMETTLFKKTDFSSLRLNIVTSFGIQISKEISDQWETVTGIPLMEFAYGMSETHTGNSLMPPEAIKYGTVGKPTFETDIKIVNPENLDEELSIGEQGLILLKSPSVFKGYRGKEEETQKSFHNGYFNTGDIGKFDSDGYLYFLGREKEMIKCSGYSVYPEEVEKMLIQHEDISQAAVIGVPDPIRGESVKAFIVCSNSSDLTKEEVIRWAKERMSAYKYPREVEFLDELPKTSSGKVLRRMLRQEESCT